MKRQFNLSSLVEAKKRSRRRSDHNAFKWQKAHAREKSFEQRQAEAAAASACN